MFVIEILLKFEKGCYLDNGNAELSKHPLNLSFGLVNLNKIKAELYGTFTGFVAYVDNLVTGSSLTVIKVVNYSLYHAFTIICFGL